MEAPFSLMLICAVHKTRRYTILSASFKFFQSISAPLDISSYVLKPFFLWYVFLFLCWHVDSGLNALNSPGNQKHPSIINFPLASSVTSSQNTALLCLLTIFQGLSACKTDVMDKMTVSIVSREILGNFTVIMQPGTSRLYIHCKIVEHL